MAANECEALFGHHHCRSRAPVPCRSGESGNGVQRISVTFNTPVYQFGGYWGSASTTRPITFQFYNSLGALIGTDNVVYSAPNSNGTLEWFGWRSSLPIQRVEYSGSWLVNDSLRFDAVPEPQIGLVFLSGLFGYIGPALFRSVAARSATENQDT